MAGNEQESVPVGARTSTSGEGAAFVSSRAALLAMADACAAMGKLEIAKYLRLEASGSISIDKASFWQTAVDSMQRSITSGHFFEALKLCCQPTSYESSFLHCAHSRDVADTFALAIGQEILRESPQQFEAMHQLSEMIKRRQQEGLHEHEGIVSLRIVKGLVRLGGPCFEDLGRAGSLAIRSGASSLPVSLCLSASSIAKIAAHVSLSEYKSNGGSKTSTNRRIGLLLALFRACVKPPPPGTDAVRPGKLLQAMSASSGFEFSYMAPTQPVSGGKVSTTRGASDDTKPDSTERQEPDTSSTKRAGPGRTGDTGPAVIEFEGRPVASIGIALESQASRSGRLADRDASEAGDDAATEDAAAAAAAAAARTETSARSGAQSTQVAQESISIDAVPDEDGAGIIAAAGLSGGDVLLSRVRLCLPSDSLSGAATSSAIAPAAWASAVGSHYNRFVQPDICTWDSRLHSGLPGTSGAAAAQEWEAMKGGIVSLALSPVISGMPTAQVPSIPPYPHPESTRFLAFGSSDGELRVSTVLTGAVRDRYISIGRTVWTMQAVQEQGSIAGIAWLWAAHGSLTPQASCGPSRSSTCGTLLLLATWTGGQTMGWIMLANPQREEYTMSLVLRQQLEPVLSMRGSRPAKPTQAGAPAVTCLCRHCPEPLVGVPTESYYAPPPASLHAPLGYAQSAAVRAAERRGSVSLPAHASAFESTATAACGQLPRPTGASRPRAMILDLGPTLQRLHMLAWYHSWSHLDGAVSAACAPREPSAGSGTSSMHTPPRGARKSARRGPKAVHIPVVAGSGCPPDLVLRLPLFCREITGLSDSKSNGYASASNASQPPKQSLADGAVGEVQDDYSIDSMVGVAVDLTAMGTRAEAAAALYWHKRGLGQAPHPSWPKHNEPATNPGIATEGSSTIGANSQSVQASTSSIDETAAFDPRWPELGALGAAWKRNYEVEPEGQSVVDRQRRRTEGHGARISSSSAAASVLAGVDQPDMLDEDELAFDDSTGTSVLAGSRSASGAGSRSVSPDTARERAKRKARERYLGLLESRVGGPLPVLTSSVSVGPPTSMLAERPSYSPRQGRRRKQRRRGDTPSASYPDAPEDEAAPAAPWRWSNPHVGDRGYHRRAVHAASAALALVSMPRGRPIEVSAIQNVRSDNGCGPGVLRPARRRVLARLHGRLHAYAWAELDSIGAGDGLSIAAGGEDGRVHVWSTGRRGVACTLGSCDSHASSIGALSGQRGIASGNSAAQRGYLSPQRSHSLPEPGSVPGQSQQLARRTRLREAWPLPLPWQPEVAPLAAETSTAEEHSGRGDEGDTKGGCDDEAIPHHGPVVSVRWVPLLSEGSVRLGLVSVSGGAIRFWL